MNEYPELRDRVLAIETTLRAFCITGALRPTARAVANEAATQIAALVKSASTALANAAGSSEDSDS